MLELHGQVQKGQHILSATQLEMKQRYLSSQKDGTFLRETYTKQGPMKTYSQVKMQFGLVVERVRCRLEEMGISVCGVPANKDMVHKILIKACGGVGDMGETLGLSVMTIDQASKFFENCRDWAATELQLVIPDPDLNWREKK